ncbi:2623_t:CDS:2 [Cetraspora pellucida]|uniref:2623_t:CDS:1 n=1 Tax=Cetraspora pellucida TaxID=1433469 RepID=A0A9N9K9R1_9GLOM|nr:2623_t:CDS:2 [Cetraspora pellucida]
MSIKSASDAAQQFIKRLNPNTNATLSGLALEIHSCSKKLLEEYGFSEADDLNYLGFEIFNEQITVDFVKSSKSVDSICYTCDKGLISRDSYRNLAASLPFLEREHTVAARCKEINELIEKQIPIKSFTYSEIEILAIYSNIIENNDEIFFN